MNDVLKTVLSMSLSGSLLILALLLCKPLFRNKISRQWQYYIWLVVIARLLLPFAPKASLVGTLFQQTQQAAVQTYSDVIDTEYMFNNTPSAEPYAIDNSAKQQDISTLMSFAISVWKHLYLIWLGAALLLFVRKLTIYQGFVNYISAGQKEVSDTALLDRLAQLGEQLGVKRPIELYTNSLISSPLLLRFFRPCIILPTTALSETDFQYTIQHELVHYKRGDMFYKWLVQITLCLHWFNPLVRLMVREMNRACELACDEVVIRNLDNAGRRAYGDALIHAMGIGGDYKSSLASVTLNESAELLKERLKAIMDSNFERAAYPLHWLKPFALAAALIIGWAVTGAYTGPAELEAKEEGGLLSDSVEQYYEAGFLPLFARVFPSLNESQQSYWLEKIYNDGELAFFSVAVNGLDMDASLIADFAGKAYSDGKIAFFSVLTNHMSKESLEAWQLRALEDKKTAFYVTLLKALDKDEELEAWEEQQDMQRMAEYAAFGITNAGKQYYYQGELVNIFLDHQTDSAFYMLDMNPLGTINIKIIRSSDGKIESVREMTESEAEELFEDMYGDEKDKEDQ